MRNLAKYAAHIGGRYVLHMPHICGIFLCIFLACANSSDRIMIMIINRPFLHSF